MSLFLIFGTYRPSARGKLAAGISMRSWVTALLVSSWDKHVSSLPVATGNLHDLEPQLISIEPQSLRALRKEHRFAMLEPDHGIGLSFLVRIFGECAIIEHGAILIDFNKARSFVGMRALKKS